MLVGDGRAGKTALARSLMGEPFEETESTIGINQITCDVKYASTGGVGNGEWMKYDKQENELEALLARSLVVGPYNQPRKGMQTDKSKKSKGNDKTVRPVDVNIIAPNAYDSMDESIYLNRDLKTDTKSNIVDIDESLIVNE